MTFEEAKKEIERLDDCLWSEFEKNPNKKTYGEAIAYEEACHILDEVDTEPVRKPDKMTLKELAHELRKIFKFKYLTVSPDFCGCPIEIYCWTSIRPTYNAKGRMWIISQEGSQTIMSSFEAWHLEKSLDLSEYADESGEIDYSRCIVEVSDDAE